MGMECPYGRPFSPWSVLLVLLGSENTRLVDAFNVQGAKRNGQTITSPYSTEAQLENTVGPEHSTMSFITEYSAAEQPR